MNLFETDFCRRTYMTKANRNKTIDISVENGAEYLNRCIKVNESISLFEIIDKTILGDIFEAPDGWEDAFPGT